MPGLPVQHQLPEPTQTYVYSVGDADSFFYMGLLTKLWQDGFLKNVPSLYLVPSVATGS